MKSIVLAPWESQKEKWVSLPLETELSSEGEKIGLVSM